MIEKFLNGYSQANLRLSPQKSKILRGQVKFLGHLVSKDGLSVDPEYVKIVKDWKLPLTRKAVRRFLGKIGYYRKFIRSFQSIAAPMTAVLKLDGTGDNDPIKPTDQYIWAFETLKERLLTGPILAHPDFKSEAPFILSTDFRLDLFEVYST